MTIEKTDVDSTRLLTHAKAIGCTLERRESNTRGRSLICPLLCQGNARARMKTKSVSRERARDVPLRRRRRRRRPVEPAAARETETRAVSLLYAQSLQARRARREITNVVELRRNSDDYERQNSTESPSPV